MTLETSHAFYNFNISKELKLRRSTTIVPETMRESYAFLRSRVVQLTTCFNSHACVGYNLMEFIRPRRKRVTLIIARDVTVRTNVSLFVRRIKFRFALKYRVPTIGPIASIRRNDFFPEIRFERPSYPR